MTHYLHLAHRVLLFILPGIFDKCELKGDFFFFLQIKKFHIKKYVPFWLHLKIPDRQQKVVQIKSQPELSPMDVHILFREK